MDQLFLFQQKTAYDLRISDWSADVCSPDLLIDRHALSGDRGLVDRSAANHDEAVSGKSLVGLDDDRVSDLKKVDRDFPSAAIGALHDRCPRREFGQRLDRTLRPTPGLMFQRVAQAEAEVKQCTLGTGPADSSHNGGPTTQS